MWKNFERISFGKTRQGIFLLNLFILNKKSFGKTSYLARHHVTYQMFVFQTCKVWRNLIGLKNKHPAVPDITRPCCSNPNFVNK